jgi:hypothetical protein
MLTLEKLCCCLLAVEAMGLLLVGLRFLQVELYRLLEELML